MPPRGRQEIEHEGDEEQLAAAHPVGQPAEIQRAEHGADEIGARRQPDIRVVETQRGARLQRAGHRTGERDLQPVEDPGDPQRRDHQAVETAPGQAFQPRGYVGDDAAVAGLGLRVQRPPEKRLFLRNAPKDLMFTFRD